MPHVDWHTPLTLGILLAAALAAGGIGELVRLPKVTAYLLAGILLGPSLLGWVKEEQVAQIEPLTRLAIALVLFTLGAHFPLAHARRIFRRAVRLSLGELLATFVLVSAGLWLIGASGPVALLLGALALATAPATTILVLKETESEGPVTEYTGALVVLNNLAAIVIFELLFLAIHLAQGKLGGSMVGELRALGLDLIGSLLLGIAGGLVVSYFFALTETGRQLVLLVAALLALLGLCDALGIPYLLTFLAMGVTVANASDQRRAMLAELDRFTGLLSVVFFVTHGSELNVRLLGAAGLIGLGYVALRCGGKFLGIRLAARTMREEPMIRRWLGATLLAQAGAAIALSAIATRRDPSLGRDLQTVILGTVVVFEILGPLLIRHAVIQAGEVPLAHAIRHGEYPLLEQWRMLWSRLLGALGYDPWKNRLVGELKVRDVMRRNVRPVPQSATFDELIETIEHSRENTFPVVNAEGHLLGLIRYRELSQALFDRELGSLVRAADVTTSASRLLFPDDSALEVRKFFEKSKDDCLPVVTPEEPHTLLGVVRRRDMLRLLIRGQLGEPSAEK